MTVYMLRRAAPLCVLLGMTSLSQAAAITFSASSGSLAASAKFDVVAGNLQVTLTNTSLSDVLVPADVLTAVFFDIPGVGALTSVSALLGGGSTVLFAAAPAGGIVGGEWAYGAGLAGAPHSASEGISSAGFGLFGASTFPGPDLEPPAAVDGLQYGITSAGDNPAVGNAAVTGSNPLIKNQVVFTLSGVPALFDPSAAGAITNVSFQYGTALNEPNIVVPLPGAAWAGLSLLGSIGGVGLFRSRRRSAELD